MNPTDYYVTQGWMYALGLTDKERTAYAIIWGYSRDGRSVCRTTGKQLSEWLGCSERHAKRIVNGLEDRGLIEHQVVSVPARRNHPGGVMTDFWAVEPYEAEKPSKKDRIDWAGRRKVGTWMSRPGRDMDVPTPLTVSRYSNNSSCGGKYNARTREKETTTTGLLFENDESGLAPGLDLAQLSLPYEQTWFVDAVKLLLQQPAWASKSAAAVQIVLDDLGALNDDMAATYICRLAVRREWDDISNARKIADDDADKISAYAGEVYAHLEGAIA